MKKCILTCMLVLSFVASSVAAPGDHPNDQDTMIWRMAAGGYTTTLINKMTAPETRIPGSASIDQDSFAHWMQIDIAFNATYNQVFPLQVFYKYLSYFDGYTYNTSRLYEAVEPPGSPTVDGVNITCAADVTIDERQPVLYVWNFVTFIETEITPTLDAGIWTFEAVPAGNYVITYGEGESLPTTYITVS